VTVETEGDGEKSVCATDEESRGESEKEMADKTRRRRKPSAPRTDAEDK
jgi:hypothetical protein